MVKRGKFREDLYFRINVMQLTIPPLRDRLQDIDILTDFFLKKHSRNMQKSVTRLADDTLRILREYDWPGNIRELENVIERAVVLAAGQCITRDLLPPLDMRARKSSIPGRQSLEEAVLAFKRDYIIRMLEETRYNQTQAARLLQIQRPYLNRLMKKLNIRRPDE